GRRTLGAGGSRRARRRARLARAADDGSGRRVPRVLARRGRLPPVSRPARRRRSPARRALLWGLVFVVVFTVGIALGQALEDNPSEGKTITQNQTLTLELESATVMVTAPCFPSVKETKASGRSGPQ